MRKMSYTVVTGSQVPNHISVQFRYKYSIYFKLRIDCLSDLQRNSKLT